MKQPAWPILLFLFLLPGAFAAEVYRSVDENGRIVYSDLPSDGVQAERIEIDAEPPAAAQRAGAAQDEPSAGDDAAGDEAAPSGAEMPREPTAEEIAADRSRNCEYARQQNETYSTAHRLFRTRPDGEREYLSDAEIDEARARAEQNVAEWCD